MVAKALSAPPLGADIDIIVDWLELKAFLSPFDQAQLDDVISTREMQIQDAETDIAEQDRAADELRTSLETEIAFRETALGSSYPFGLSADGELLEIRRPEADDFASPAYPYLLCLILSHTTNSPVLNMPPTPEMVRQARKRLFQVVATLAAAGHAQGGATSLGWPREKKETIIDVVTRAVIRSGTGAAKLAPDQLEPKGAKDGGLDVLAWKCAPGGPPPELFYFVQAASGHNWPGKSARDDHRQFIACYFNTPPSCNEVFLTVCPFRLSEQTKQYNQLSHGAISDRTSVPTMVMAAMAAAANGNSHIDEVENYPIIGKWVSRYQRENRSAR